MAAYLYLVWQPQLDLVLSFGAESRMFYLTGSQGHIQGQGQPPDLVW